MNKTCPEPKIYVWTLIWFLKVGDGKVPLKDIALKCWIAMDKNWNKKLPSLMSLEDSQIRRPNCMMKSWTQELEGQWQEDVICYHHHHHVPSSIKGW